MALDLKNIKIDFKNINFRTVYEWPVYGRTIILALVFIAVLYLGYFFNFSELSDQIYTRYKQEQELKQQIKASLKVEADLKEIVARYPEILKLLNEWEGQLIEGNKLPDLLNQILKLGADNHLHFSLFAPGAKQQENSFFKVPIKVLIRGNYNQVANFISQIANLPQIVAVSDFLMIKKAASENNVEKGSENKNQGDYLSTSLTLEVYYLAHKK